MGCGSAVRHQQVYGVPEDNLNTTSASHTENSPRSSTSSSGSGAPGPTLAEVLYGEVKVHADVFKKGPHDVCVFSTLTPTIPSAAPLSEAEFTAKPFEYSGCGSDGISASQHRLMSSGAGMFCMKGRKPDDSNQDNFFFLCIR